MSDLRPPHYSKHFKAMAAPTTEVMNRQVRRVYDQRVAGQINLEEFAAELRLMTAEALLYMSGLVTKRLSGPGEP